MTDQGVCRVIRIVANAGFVVVLGLATTLPSATASSQQNYAATLASARREGSVIVAGPPGADQRRAITENWAKAFPGITLDYTGARGTQIISKIVRERLAGIYNWDVILASTNPAVFTLVPMHALAPFREAIITPDISDDKTWIDGFAAGFMDKEGEYLYSPTGNAGLTLGFVNRSCVPKSELHDAADLASSKLKGKIAWYDPTRPGSGSRSTWRLAVNKGDAWLNELFKAQDVTFSRDYRQMADWVVSCHKPVGIGMPFDVIMQMQKHGVGKSVEELTGPAYFGRVPVWESANDHVAWFDKAPHPAAAKIFVNWYLSRKFQQAYTEATRSNSRRTDVRPGDPNPNHVMDPAAQYTSAGDEAATVKIKALQKEIKNWDVLN
jgi:ABC-type Fe3+ transport system substrate-binding protein